MSVITVLKNQKANKIKKYHMKSILNEVKNKTMIEDIDNERKFTEDKIIKRWADRKKSSQPVQVEKNKSILNEDLTANKELKQEQIKSNQQSHEIFEHSHLRRQSKLESKLKRKSSKLQFQLDQIVKYSQMYPSRMDAEKQLNENLQKLVANTSNQVRSSRVNKSRFLVEFQIKNDKENGIKTKRKSKNQLLSPTIKWKSHDTKNRQILEKRRYTRNTYRRRIDDQLVLNLVENSFVQEEDQTARKQYTNYLIKKSKAIIGRNKKPFDYSFSHFMQNELNTLRQKNGRKTVYPYLERLDKSHENADLREQNLYNVHRFLRGECKQEDQYCKQITVKEIKKFQEKYDLYNKIYKKTKECMKADKFDLHNLKQLTVKNAIYLNETLTQCNTIDKKREVQKIMKGLNFNI